MKTNKGIDIPERSKQKTIERNTLRARLLPEDKHDGTQVQNATRTRNRDRASVFHFRQNDRKVLYSSSALRFRFSSVLSVYRRSRATVYVSCLPWSIHTTDEVRWGLRLANRGGIRLFGLLRDCPSEGLIGLSSRRSIQKNGCSSSPPRDTDS